MHRLPSSTKKISAYILVGIILVTATWVIAQKIVRDDYQNRLALGQSKADELATFFEADTLKILTIADNFVRKARSDYLKERETFNIAEFYEDAFPHNDFVSNLVLIGPDGVIKGQTNGNSFGADVLDEPYFANLRDNPEESAYVTPPDQGRFTGRLTVGLVRRIELADGSFDGAILAAINADEFTDFFSTVNLGPNSSATLVGLDKLIRARSSYGRFGPGQDISDWQLWSELAQSRVGQYLDTSAVDGVTRSYSYRQIANFPLLVAISLANEDVLKGASVFSRPLYFVASLISLVIIVLIAMLCLAEFGRRRLQAENTVRRAAEKELEAANTDLAQFAYSASHDLKAPLSSIRGLLEFCVEDLECGDHDEVRKNLDSAIGVSSRAALKVESLLRLAKAGNQVVPVEEFSLGEMLTDIWKDQSAFLDARCRLDLQIEEVPSVVTEKATMQVILENIISNAIRYRDEQKPETLINVCAHSAGDETAIVISDNGVGIAARDQSKVFGMFKRADDRAGDGLGLALVKKNVERLGAEIKLKSKRGKGTELTLKFRKLEGEKT